MKKTPPKAGAMLHFRGQGLAKGEPISPPIVNASMYNLPGTPEGPGYGRADNATWEAAEHMLAQLEDTPTILFPSGMAAISAALFTTLKAGDRLLLPADGYYATREFARLFLSGLGVEVIERQTKSFAEGGFDGFRAVFIETPSNPGLDLIDLAAVTGEVRAAGGVSIVDNTTMTPFGQRPLEMGADILVASDTKAPGGHSDLLMGHLSTRDYDLMQRAKDWRKFAGSIPGPMEAWLLHRGLETLELRFERMCNTAEAIAPRLAAHPRTQALRYPGLAEDPGHDLAGRQMLRPGFLMQLTLADAATAERFIDTCPMLRPATSFGGIHSSAERRARWGDAVPAGAIRLSVGCEPAEELWGAIEAALDAL